MSFRKDNYKNNSKSNFTKITISLASPETIQESSSGEVTKPETINYRTYKPERDGLFCEKIFGPVKDYECNCGKYKRIRYKGLICDRCGVEITEKKVRRERMGHIKLEIPVAHIWYFKTLPSKIGYLLGLPGKKLEAVIYYERYIVLNPGVMADKNMSAPLEPLEKMDLLSEEEYIEVMNTLPKDNALLDNSDPNKFIAKIGAEAIYDLLAEIDIDKLSYELRHSASNENSQQRKNEALKRLNVVEAFRQSKGKNRPEWMIVKIIPVIPPELRPLVALDGGRFASSDLNDLYRRVIIRNNRLRKMLVIKAPEVILRSEKRMLQEAVDSLFDNSRKATAVKVDSNRPLKSLSDSLKGKQGRFRQNLLGKRVDFSARSVIVVGPELKMHECGMPKDMAAELFKPFIIRKIIERGIVKTVKSAKKMVERKDPVIWDILENILKGHPILLNRAPTLHRLGIQAFQPKLIEGKAIQLHPLVCTAFNADFDGDQMAVHLPLGNAAIIEAQVLMLASHNILNPANGAPITVPSQDMVLGLYYITKIKKGLIGEGKRFYSPEEVIIALNEKKLALHSEIEVFTCDGLDSEGNEIIKLIKTSAGRILFNQVVPKEYGFINILLTKKTLRDIIGNLVTKCGTAKTAQFLDDIKDLGYYHAFRGGLSFNLSNVIIPEKKAELIANGDAQIEEILFNYNNGFITDKERYNQVIDVWTNINARLSGEVMKTLSSDDQGFNPVYMMLDSGARGSKEQISQLCGMRGLMAKPQKSGSGVSEIIENPILSNFKEGLSILEYFVSTHGARKGLADTALKTADAGYLTRRLVDVSHDVIITEEDCGTLRGLTATELKNSNEEVIESLYEKILGRVSVETIKHPQTNEIIVSSGEEITEEIAKIIEESPIEKVEIRSVLTCESRKGVCEKCYGRNLATHKMVQTGEVVGVIAAQSIGEPGTQLTLRTFHMGGVAGNITGESSIIAKYDGIVEYEETRFVTHKEDNGKIVDIVVNRMAELKILDSNTRNLVFHKPIPYGSKLFYKNGDTVKKGDVICEWDLYNIVIISEWSGKMELENIVEGINLKIETDIQTGNQERIIVETKDKTRIPVAKIVGNDGDVLGSYNLPVGARLFDYDKKKQKKFQIQAGDILIKMPRIVSKGGDITGGLPRVTELFEARNPSNPAIVSEIDGEVKFGRLVRGNREITIQSKEGSVKKHLVPLVKQILVQPNDYIKAGTPLIDGAITPSDILAIKGPTAVQEYLVNEIQDVYRLQGVKINDKHFETIVRQMMRKVEIENPGDTQFLEKQIVDKWDFREENDRIFDKKIVEDPGDSETLFAGEMITYRRYRDENSQLKRKDLKLVQIRDAVPATSTQILQGITKAALQTHSFMSAASFQETTKVLNEAAIRAKSDNLEGLKENVIVGHLIPAGTGQRRFQDLRITNKEKLEQLKKAAEIDSETENNNDYEQ